MNIFLTGSTGYLGSYLAERLLRQHTNRLSLLIRAKSVDEAHVRLWKALQLHMKFDEFISYLNGRIDIYLGDLTTPGFGLDLSSYDKLVKSTGSVIHCAASLNRKSDKACLNVNLRGTLSVLKLARAAKDHHGLRRFSDISTVAVAGKRNHELVLEDYMIDWDRSDYDPYARTKKFCEHMTHELLPDITTTVFRPSIVLGDSRFPGTTQFDMVWAFVFLAGLPVLPFDRSWKLDIVPADFVAKGIVDVHQKENPRFNAYNLSAGEDSLSYEQILQAMYAAGFNRRNFLIPSLKKPTEWMTNLLMNTPRSWKISGFASLLKVFLPYLTFDTTFENRRIVAELNEKPKAFSSYALPLLQFAKTNHFKYPYIDWPQDQLKGRSHAANS